MKDSVQVVGAYLEDGALTDLVVEQEDHTRYSIALGGGSGGGGGGAVGVGDSATVRTRFWPPVQEDAAMRVYAKGVTLLSASSKVNGTSVSLIESYEHPEWDDLAPAFQINEDGLYASWLRMLFSTDAAEAADRKWSCDDPVWWHPSEYLFYPLDENGYDSGGGNVEHWGINWPKLKAATYAVSVAFPTVQLPAGAVFHPETTGHGSALPSSGFYGIHAQVMRVG